METTSLETLPDKIFQWDKPFYNNTPTVNSSTKKVQDPKKVTYLLKQQHGLLLQTQWNWSFCHQTVRYLYAQHIFNKHKAMNVYNKMGKK